MKLRKRIYRNTKTQVSFMNDTCVFVFGGYRPRVGGGLTSGFECACKRVGIKDKDVTQL